MFVYSAGNIRRQTKFDHVNLSEKKLKTLKHFYISLNLFLRKLHLDKIVK